MNNSLFSLLAPFAIIVIAYSVLRSFGGEGTTIRFNVSNLSFWQRMIVIIVFLATIATNIIFYNLPSRNNKRDVLINIAIFLAGVIFGILRKRSRK